MKKKILVALAGFIVFIFFFVLLAPARVVLPWFIQGIPQVAVQGVSGTVWNTSLDSVLYNGNTINDVAIKTSFWNLLLANLKSDISVNDQNLMLDGRIIVNSDQLRIEDARYQLDVSSLQTWLKLPVSELSGSLIGHIDNAVLQIDDLIDLQANGYWQNAVVGYPNSVLELGDIHFTIERTEDGKALLTITNNPGMLDLKGTLEIALDKKYRLTISTKTDIPSHIKQWLTKLGRTENNRIYIKWNGRLP